jgi:hypothetical protein
MFIKAEEKIEKVGPYPGLVLTEAQLKRLEQEGISE